MPWCACSNLPRCRDGRPGERPLLVPEQLALDQLARHRRAVQRDERPATPRAPFVQRARDQLLARARLAQDADARLAGRDALHLRHHPPHRLARVHDLVLADALPQLPILLLQPLQLEDVVHRQQQLVGGERLLQEIDGAEPRRPHRHLDIRLPGDHHHRQRDARVAEVFEQRQAVLARHHHVATSSCRTAATSASSSARAALSHTVASWPASRKARASDASVFWSSSTIKRCAIASSIRNVVPLPGSLSTESAFMIAHYDCTIARPSPCRASWSCSTA